MKVEIRIVTDTGEFAVVHHQPRDKIGRPLDTPAGTLKAAYTDAAAWLRRSAAAKER